MGGWGGVGRVWVVVRWGWSGVGRGGGGRISGGGVGVSWVGW